MRLEPLLCVSSIDSVAGTAIYVLLSSAIQATLLLAAVVAVTCWMPRASASSRHFFWLSALIGVAALPVLTFSLPGWSVLPDWADMPALAERGSGAFSYDLEKSVRSDVSQPASHRVESDDGRVIAPVAGTNGPTGGRLPWRSSLLAVWMAGCAAALVPVLLGRAGLRRLERESMQVDGGPLGLVAKRVAGRLEVKRSVRVLLSGQRSMPMLWGIFRPHALLPEVAGDWSTARVEAVLMHEFAHVRRHDCLARLAARLVCAAYWYHPLVWWTARRMRADCETACDDLVLRAGCPPTDYAEHLLHVAAGTRTGLPLGSAAIGMAWRSRLDVRLRAILDDRRNRRSPNRLAAAGCVGLVALLAVPLASLRSEPRPDSYATETAPADVSDLVSPFTPARAKSVFDLGPPAVRFGYVDDTAEGKRSIAGGGHAVKFRRPEGVRYLMAIEIFAHRYGYTAPPAEDFHVYILDEKQKVIQACPYPYARIEWGFPHWHMLKLPAVEIPKEYYVCLVFNPEARKGIYLGLDESVKRSHSYIGRPTTRLEPVAERYDWMIRSVLVDEIPKENPFGAD